jgi:hypothetical protein
LFLEVFRRVKSLVAVGVIKDVEKKAASSGKVTKSAVTATKAAGKK